VVNRNRRTDGRGPLPLVATAPPARTLTPMAVTGTTEKTLSLLISRRRVADSVPRLFRGSPGQPSLGFRGSCLTIFGDASEGCTYYRTIASPKARSPGPNEPSVPGEVSVWMRRWWWLSERSRGTGHRWIDIRMPSGPSQSSVRRDVSRKPILVIRVSRDSRLASLDPGATGESRGSMLASPVHRFSLVPRSGPF
jgi:hypothetical protein